MQGMAERCHVDDECLRAIGDGFGWPGQPGCFPRWKQKQQFRIGRPRGRPEQQRDDFGFAVELQESIPRAMRLWFARRGRSRAVWPSRRDKIPGMRQRASAAGAARALSHRGDQETCSWRRRVCRNGTQMVVSRGKGMSASPAFSGAIHTARSPFHFLARTSSANLQSRSAVNAGFSSVKA